jgi:hypothetical protein
MVPGRVNVITAGELRLTLERLFGWHVVTLTEAMARTERGDIDLQRWMDALASNTDDIVAAVGLVYGPVGAGAFAQQWSNHTQFLIDYAAAIANHDAAAGRRALAKLADYAHDRAALLDRATEGKAPATTVEQLLRQHVSEMTTALDAAAAGHADEYAQLSVTAHSYSIDIGDALAGAIAAQQTAAFPGPLDAVRQCCVPPESPARSGAMPRAAPPTTIAGGCASAHNLLTLVDSGTGHVG